MPKRVLTPARPLHTGRGDTAAVRRLADQAFSRAAGAALSTGNTVRLLRDAEENYPAWLDAIAAARRTIHFESYIIYDDEVGERFARALLARAAAGVRVRVLYDWLGAVGKTSRNFWQRLREGGVRVRAFNPPRLDEPLGWLARDHRKLLVVDDAVAFVSGLCVGAAWSGDPERGLEPWRDTGVQVRGPVVAEAVAAFADAWEAAGGRPFADGERPDADAIPVAGDYALRLVATTTGTAGLYRLDTMIAALARSSLWLADAYFAATPPYVEALRAAARDGVDVRLLVPGAGNDLPLVQAISRAGYRSLLEAGVRIFEWNGPMMHAKTAVADARWARVGSTNLNVASWMGNWELDVVVEDGRFGRAMADMYERDLTHATEIVLGRRRRLAPRADAAPAAPRPRPVARTVRATAGALRASHAIGSALTARRLLVPTERRVLVQGALLLAGLGAIALLWPPVLAWPLALLLVWLGTALGIRALRIGAAEGAPDIEPADGADAPTG
jgi:cardiolipin synthase